MPIEEARLVRTGRSVNPDVDRHHSDPAKRTGAVALIAPCPFPANHGTPASIREIVQTQVRLGYDVHIFTYPLWEKDLKLEAGPNFHRMPMLGMSRKIKVGPMWRKPIWNLMIALKIVALSAKHDFKVIHAYNYEGALFGWLAHLILRRPLVVSHHNTMVDELPTYDTILPKWLVRWVAVALDYWVPRMATKTVAISEPIVRFLHSKGIHPSRIIMIPLGVYSSEFKNRDGQKIRDQYELGDRPIVMYAGLLNRFQRLDYLFEGMVEVRRTRPDACLMLVTNYIEPTDRCMCERLLDRYDLRSNVIITEPQPFKNVPDYLAAANVCVVSRPDCPGVPFKMLNYMASGKSMVVPVGSSMGLTHEHDVYLVADHDGVALGKGVLELLNNDKLRKRLETQAPVTLERRFGLTAICDRLGEVYAELSAMPALARGPLFSQPAYRWNGNGRVKSAR